MQLTNSVIGECSKKQKNQNTEVKWATGIFFSVKLCEPAMSHNFVTLFGVLVQTHPRKKVEIFRLILCLSLIIKLFYFRGVFSVSMSVHCTMSFQCKKRKESYGNRSKFLVRKSQRRSHQKGVNLNISCM